MKVAYKVTYKTYIKFNHTYIQSVKKYLIYNALVIILIKSV